MDVSKNVSKTHTFLLKIEVPAKSVNFLKNNQFKDRIILNFSVEFYKKGHCNVICTIQKEKKV